MDLSDSISNLRLPLDKCQKLGKTTEKRKCIETFPPILFIADCEFSVEKYTDVIDFEFILDQSAGIGDNWRSGLSICFGKKFSKPVRFGYRHSIVNGDELLPRKTILQVTLSGCFRDGDEKQS